jgi:hypothetical protein
VPESTSRTEAAKRMASDNGGKRNETATLASFMRDRALCRSTPKV